MTLLEGIVLGIIQGITEFLPVSSSGHLVIASRLFDINDGNLFYSVMLHFSSLLAVLIYFRKDVIKLIISFFELLARINKTKRKETLNLHERIVLLIIAGTIPTVIIGLLFKDFFETLYNNINSVGIALLFTGFILIISEKISKPKYSLIDIPFYKTVFIGIFQGIAIIPGVSRSGSTIVGSLFMGLEKEDAARFSFLLSIPAIIGATLIELLSINTTGVVLNANLMIGMITSFLFGMISIGILINLIKKGKLYYFAIYVFAVALLIFLFF